MAQARRSTVSLDTSVPRALAVVHARLPCRLVPASFAQYLDQVYAAARSGAVRLDGQNVFIYRNVPGRPDEAEVAFGVGVTATFTAVGAVEPATLPAGEVATITHWGAYGQLG